MVAPAVEGIDLFKIAGRSISGWIPSLKTGTTSPVRQPFWSQFEERLLRSPSHDKRKTRTPNTEQRWAMEKTIWEGVGGERK